MKKLLSLLLAGLLLVGALASCATGDQNTDTTAGDTTAASEEETRETLDVPDTRYDGEELCFLTRDHGEWTTLEIFAENQTTDSDNISTAVFERNDRILQTYGVTITEILKETTSQGSALTNEVSAPTGDFLAMIGATSDCASFASKGYLWDLNSDAVEYLDFTKAWWDTNMAEGLSFNDRVYFATGDLLTTDNDATFVLLFNKQLVTDCGIPDLYALVENNEWTMQRMYEFEQTAIQDKNGDGKLTYNTDVCGLAYTGDVPSAMLIGGGITLCTKDENDYPVYELNVERAQNIADLGKLIFAKDYTVDMNNPGDGTGIYEVGQITFGGGHALFFGEVMQSVTRMRGYDVDFGILPYPMYNEQQEGYYSMMHYYASSCVAIPKSVSESKLVMVNSMIEAMAYHAVDTLTEQYYEINLKTKGAKDEQSGPMMDKILSGRVYDLSYYYNWSNAFGTLAGCLLPSGGKSVASTSKTYERAINRAIEQLEKALTKFED